MHRVSASHDIPILSNLSIRSYARSRSCTMPERRDFRRIMSKSLLIPITWLVLAPPLQSAPQQPQPPKAEVEKTSPARPATPPKTEQPPQEASQSPREEVRSQR